MPSRYIRRSRRTRRPRRRMRRRGRAMIRRPFAMNNAGVHMFKRSFTADLTFVTDPVNGETSTIANSVALNLLPNFTDFTNLFDQYKILSVGMKLIYEGGNIKENDPSPLNPPVDQLPVIYTVPDIDDEGAVTFPQVLEHGKMRMHQIQTNGKVYKQFYIPPFVENSVVGLDDAVAYAAQPRKSPWIDTARNDLTHGTLKIAVSGSPNTTYRFKRVFTITLMCKNSR